MKMVSDKGADVSYYDAFVKKIKMNGRMKFVEEGKVKKSFSLTSIMESVPLTAENLGEYDCVVLTTNCTDYDMAFIKEYSKLNVDVREMVKEISDKI
jgi:UDP-N-acetyl-D-mannosaminuronate dehydrogenase